MIWNDWKMKRRTLYFIRNGWYADRHVVTTRATVLPPFFVSVVSLCQLMAHYHLHLHLSQNPPRSLTIYTSFRGRLHSEAINCVIVSFIHLSLNPSPFLTICTSFRGRLHSEAINSVIHPSLTEPAPFAHNLHFI